MWPPRAAATLTGMACCIAIALVIALIRTGWYALLPGRRPPESGFAPSAYRAGPAVDVTVDDGDSAGRTWPVRTPEVTP